MKINIHKKLGSHNGLLLVSVFEEDLAKLSYPSAVSEFVRARMKEDGFKAEKGSLLSTYEKSGKIVVLGCGKKKDFTEKLARELGAKAAKQCRALKAKEVTVLSVPHTSEFFEGMLLTQYDIGQFKSEKKKDTVNIEIVNFVSEDKGLESELKKSAMLVEASNYTKDLVNMPANILDVDRMEREARQIAKENRYKITVFNDKQLRKLKMGGILAVNSGSRNTAKLMILEYSGGKRGDKPAILVGKGVLFDTGGYNLKPVNSIETMQQDMGGGGTVLGVFSVMKKLGLKRNVIGIIPVVENMISESAYRPSDILTMYSGKTVEITNTDAEGRLILADALTYATKMKPEFIVSIATLTGAVGVALGDRYAGLLGNDHKLLDALEKAGEEVDELGWKLPIHDDYREKLKSKVADLKNYDLGTGRYGGCLKAAAFLENFVGDCKWGHIDIGGTAFTSDPKEYQAMGATGHGLRLLLKFLGV